MSSAVDHLKFQSVSTWAFVPNSIFSLFHGRLCAGRWHLWAGTPTCGWTLWHAGSSDQDPVRPTELPCCSSRRLELAAYTPALNLRQSWTVQRWVEDPSLHTGLRIPLRTFCLRVYTKLTLTFYWHFHLHTVVLGTLHWTVVFLKKLTERD